VFARRAAAPTSSGPTGRAGRGSSDGSSCQLPNMRLKLSGLFLRESAVRLPGAPLWGRPVPCAGGHVARSLSAIR